MLEMSSSRINAHMVTPDRGLLRHFNGTGAIENVWTCIKTAVVMRVFMFNRNRVLVLVFLLVIQSCRTLASSKIVLHCSRTCDLSLQFFTLMFLNLCSYWVVFIFSTRFQILEPSQQNVFLCGRVIKSQTNPNLEDQGIHFCLRHHLWPV
jgi:hypothetical protein